MSRDPAIGLLHSASVRAIATTLRHVSLHPTDIRPLIGSTLPQNA